MASPTQNNAFSSHASEVDRCRLETEMLQQQADKMKLANDFVEAGAPLHHLVFKVTLILTAFVAVVLTLGGVWLIGYDLVKHLESVKKNLPWGLALTFVGIVLMFGNRHISELITAAASKLLGK